MNLEGKIALVTGSSKGIGKATVIALAKSGAIPVVTGGNARTIYETTEEIRSFGGECLDIVIDIRDKIQIKQMVEKVLTRYKKIDILVNNVGGSAPPVALNEFPDDLWGAQIMHNLTTVFYCSRAVVGFMKERRWGRVVNIASLAGRSYSQLGGVAYAAAKHGVVGFTRQLARELASYSITVNCVAPGFIGTERVLEKFGTKTEAEQDDIIRNIPLNRLGRPEEVANVVVFLASDLASYITGATIDVNGGLLMI